MGHLGLTPQSINVIGGHKIQGKTREAAESEGPPDPRACGLLRACARACADAARCPHLPQTDHPHHRHRRGPRLRRAGAGYPRPARLVSRLHAQARPQIHRHGRRPHHRLPDYMADVQSGAFPAEENSFPMDESSSMDCDRLEYSDRQEKCKWFWHADVRTFSSPSLAKSGEMRILLE